MPSPPQRLREGHRENSRARGRPTRRTGGTTGRWLAAGVVFVGLILALVGLKYRQFEPKATTTAPVPSRGEN